MPIHLDVAIIPIHKTVLRDPAVGDRDVFAGSLSLLMVPVGTRVLTVTGAHALASLNNGDGLHLGCCDVGLKRQGK